MILPHPALALEAVILGSVAAIAGTAVLAYANRPECRTNETASGCGYGTKVVGDGLAPQGVLAFCICH